MAFHSMAEINGGDTKLEAHPPSGVPRLPQLRQAVCCLGGSGPRTSNTWLRTMGSNEVP